MTTRDELEATIARIVQPGKGIVAADESMPTITKRFKAVGIDSTEETRRQYRQLLFTTRGVSEFVAGFILFEETLGQKADDGTPLAEVLVRQSVGIVPIVEPEVLIDGDHTLERCHEVSGAVLHAVFSALHRHGVRLECMVLKPSMVLPGKGHPPKASPEVVAANTLEVLRRNVPAAVPTINFLSGGQSPEEATANLNAMNIMATDKPWVLSFSYARALQDPPMKLWVGRAENVRAAQQAFYQRLKMNSLARDGKYRVELEKAA